MGKLIRASATFNRGTLLHSNPLPAARELSATAPLSTETIANHLSLVAESLENDQSMNSAKLAPPITNYGRLACAWAVNRVSKAAFNFPVGGQLATAAMYIVLSERDQIITDSSKVVPGTIVISPTIGNKTGHVGIVVGGGRILSNSSRKGIWTETQSRIEEWTSYFADKRGLETYFFTLSPSRFEPTALTS